MRLKRLFHKHVNYVRNLLKPSGQILTREVQASDNRQRSWKNNSNRYPYIWKSESDMTGDTGYPDSLMYGGKPQLHPVQSSTSQNSNRSAHKTRTANQTTNAKFRRTPDPALQCSCSVKSAGSERVLITEGVEEHSGSEDNITIYDDPDDLDTDSFVDSCQSVGEQDADADGDNGYDTDLEIDGEEWLRGVEKFDPTGIESYIRECNRLGVIPVTYFQRHIQEKKFVMRNHGLGPLGAKALAKPLEGNTVIETVDLEGNFIQAEGATYLSRMLRENLFITDLVLSENRLCGEGAQAVCTALHENTTVTKLDLSGNFLRDKDGAMFHLLLQQNTSLRSLVLRNNNFASETARCLRDCLSDNESLRVLDVGWNNFRLKDGVLIAEGIQENYGLKQLDVSMNGFGVEGAIAMGHALMHNQCLEELDMSNNRILDDGAIGLAKGLTNNETLIALKLEKNMIRDSGSLAIVQTIERNSNSPLKYVNLLTTIVTQEFENIRVQLQRERGVEFFHSGVSTKSGIVFMDMMDAEAMYNRDPMTKIRKWADQEGLRLVDIFQRFDKDKSWTVDREEFIMGIRSTGLNISDSEIDLMLEKLDTDENGEIDYRELAEGDAQNRAEKRRLAALKLQQEEEDAAAAWQAALQETQEDGD